MRPKGGNPTLGELMGEAKATLGLKDIETVLGEKTPEIPRNALGRFRLMKSLQQRFGNGYRAIPGVMNIIKEFDEDVRFSGVLDKLGAIKPAPKEKK